MKKIIGLTVAALMVMGLVGGGTWAYFNDPETSTGNILSAGTMDLNINNDDINYVMLSVNNAYPGSSGNGSTTLNNIGNLTGDLDIDFATVVETAGNLGEYAGGTELGGVATIAPFLDIDQSGTWNTNDILLTTTSNSTTTNSGATALTYSTISSYSGKTWSDVTTMAQSSPIDFYINYLIPTSAGNNIQGDRANMSITFTLEQTDVD